MTHFEIREEFLKFFEERGHKVVPSASLIPSDQSVLFTTAGMQQFKSYFTGQADPMNNLGSLNAASIQKCLRTSDIDSVGDESHLTFFEMLGNFSFNGYGKKEAIEYAYEFITKNMALEIDYVSVFEGAGEIPADDESEKIWQQIAPGIKIKKAGLTDNFWGPTGDEGPCGPTTEIYVNEIEVWNLVFNQYYRDKDGHLEPLAKFGVDTGMGLERLAMAVQKTPTIFETDLFQPIITLLPENSAIELRIKRVISDHSRSIAFLVSDGVTPSNKDQGYVLRRLMRRVAVYLHLSDLETDLMKDIFAQICLTYGPFYKELDGQKIFVEFKQENDKFQKSLERGLKEMERFDKIDNESAFRLYESFGLPYEIIKELGAERAAGLNRSGFEEEFRKHQKKSRAGAEKKFGI